MKHLLFTVITTSLVLGATPPLQAETSFPMIMSLHPAAACQGSVSEHEMESRYSMFGSSQLMVSGEGVTGEILTPMTPNKDGKPPSLTRLKIRLKVTEGALPGIRDLRVVGPTGPSTLGQVLITSNPIVVEQPKNNTPEQAQTITLPATVCGRIESAEDVDYFRFTITQPQTIQFHGVGMRLQDRIHDLQSHVDPILTIRDATTGSTVATANNNFAADPLLSHEFTRPGEYLLEIRDVRYQGNKYWEYAVEISPRTFVTQVHPLGLSAASGPTRLELVTAGRRTSPTVTFTPGQDLTSGIHEVQLPLEEGVSNPVSIVMSSVPCVMESESPINTPESAQDVTVPCGINGRIEAASDVDCYRFSARKGDRLSVEVFARRNNSDLDSTIRILNQEGKQLTEVDDLQLWGRYQSQDSRLEYWSVPADGNYVIEIRDVHLRGGPGFVYFLQLTHTLPEFELALDSDRSWITPGSFCPIFVRAIKKNGFQGEIQLHIEGLPAGVTAHCGRILTGSIKDGCILLSAPADAAPAAANVRIFGTASIEQGGQTIKLSADARALQETYMPGGGRSHYPVEMHTVAVSKPGDVLSVNISEKDLTLKPGESKTIQVEIQRAPGFATNVTLDMLMQHLSNQYANPLPQGVTIDTKASKMLLTGSNSKGTIVLKAADNAPPIEKHLCCVMANVSVNFVVKVTTSSPPLTITVAAAEGKK